MKKLIIILLFAPLALSAQKPWEKFDDMDSVEFVDQFGTVAQYEFQKSIEQKSNHKTLCLFVGAKPIWLYNFATYLGYKNYNVTFDEGDGEIIVEASPKIFTTDTAPVLKLNAPYNESAQTVSVKITGPADDMIKIFLDYWQLSDVSLNDLKAKKAIVKEMLSDKVSFTWTGIDPVITVSKNERAAIDLFPVK
jgi:hypothetical protein